MSEMNIMKRQHYLLKKEEMDFHYWHEDVYEHSGKRNKWPTFYREKRKKDINQYFFPENNQVINKEQEKIEEVKKSAPISKKDTEKNWTKKSSDSAKPPRSFYVEHVNNKIIEVEEGSTKGLMKKFESNSKPPQTQ